VLIGARIVVAAALLVAAVAKLADRPGTERGVVELGLPPGWAGAVGRLLPIVELAVAVGLLVDVSARWAGLAALGLLAAFLTLMVLNLARGRTPDCHCFGQIHSAPIGTWAVVRNVVLAALAGLVFVAGPGPSLIG
jgi:hypothetical protein